MKKSKVKKIFISSLLVLLSIYFINFLYIQEQVIFGADYARSNFWDGTGLDQPLEHVNFTSKYKPFNPNYQASEALATDEYYVLRDANDLYEWSQACLGENKHYYLSCNYVLGNNIDYTDAANKLHLFVPIGFNLTSPFLGTFDGQGFEISNLYYKPILSDIEYNSPNFYNSDIEYYAFIARVGEGAVVKNVGIINPIMTQSFRWDSMIHVSYAIGLNQGTVSNIYVIDNREDAGINFDDGFCFAGLVSVNEGIFKNSFLSTKRIDSIHVTVKVGTCTMIYDNKPSGTVQNIYYDTDVYELDIDDLEDGVINPFELDKDGEDVGDALESNQNDLIKPNEFQNSGIFDEGWYFNDSYASIATLNNVYPILFGLTYSGGKFVISDAIDLVYLSKFLLASPAFQSCTYEIVNDIDMNKISNYRAPSVSLQKLSSAPIGSNHDKTLYSHSNRGAQGYFSIIDLKIYQSTTIGTYASYGLLGVLTGTVENLNLVNVKMEPSDTESHQNKERTVVGIVAGNLQGGTINNVHVYGDITFPEGKTNGKLYVGGIAGYGIGTINNSTTNGSITGNKQKYHVNFHKSAIGGFIGYTTDITITSCVNDINITGFSINDSTIAYTQYLGGFVGFGGTRLLRELSNQGNILSQVMDLNGYVSSIRIGGIIGGQTASSTTDGVFRIINKGNLALYLNRAVSASLSGFGQIQLETTTPRNYDSLANTGQISTIVSIPAGQFNATEIAKMNIEIAGVAITSASTVVIEGAYNKANLTVDMSVCNNFAANIINNRYYQTDSNGDLTFNNNNLGTGRGALTLNQSYNEGDIQAITTREVYFEQIKISGNTLGKYIRFDEVRNTGDISVTFSHNASIKLSQPTTADGVSNPYKRLKVVGIGEELSNNYRMTNCFNGGNISVTMNSGLDVRFLVFVSGILYDNVSTANQSSYQNITIDSNSIGSMNNCINDGAIYISGEFYGNIYAAGIVIYSRSLIVNCVNTGNIYSQNQIKNQSSDDFFYSSSANSKTFYEFDINSAGICFLLLYGSRNVGQIRDCMNYGNITSYAYSSNDIGYANAAGIAITNARTKQGQKLQTSNSAYYSKIQATINYGDITAWNNADESNLTFAYEPKCKAAGILLSGVMSVINVINYGNIYSRTVASGICGVLTYRSFTSYNSNAVFIANIINYGKIQQLLVDANNTCPFTYQENSMISFQSNRVSNQYVEKPANLSGTGFKAFGAIIGKISTANTNTINASYSGLEWVFISGVNSLQNVKFSCFINFNPNVDIIGLSSNANIAGNSPGSQSTIDLVEDINLNMATLKPNDYSPYPFNQITSYTLDSSETGIFHESFYIKTPLTSYTFETDDQIAKAFTFISTDHTNSSLMSKIGLVNYDPEDKELGLYALLSQGSGSGIVIPDHINLNNFNPHFFDDEGAIYEDKSWQNENSITGKDIIDKFDEMKQQTKSKAADILDLNLISTDQNIILRNPTIDLLNRIVTYYIYSNYPEACGTVVQETTLVDRYIGGSVALTENAPIYSEATQTFLPQIDSGVVSEKAYIVYNDTELNLPAKIPTVEGFYEQARRNSNHELIYDMPLNYGKVRVCSEVYNSDDERTYKDYTIRIIRLSEPSFIDVNALSINNVGVTPVFDPDIKNINISEPELAYNGQFSITYQTNNFLNQTNLLSYAKLYRIDGTTETSVSISFSNGIVSANNNYESINGQAGEGQVTFNFTFTAAMRSGQYIVKITLPDQITYQIRVKKQLSPEARITDCRVQGYSNTPPNAEGVITSYIPFGIYYRGDTATRSVDFSRVYVYNIPQSNLSGNNLPSYLSRLTISTFATLVSAEFVGIEYLDRDAGGNVITTGRRCYIFEYVIRAEDGVTTNTFTHRLEEQIVNPDLIQAYRDGDVLSIPENNEFAFDREEYPFYLFFFNYSNLFIDPINAPLIISPESSANNFNLTKLDGEGFTVDFLVGAEKKTYLFSQLYEHSKNITIGASTETLSWRFEFDSILIEKLRNRNSKLINITFVSDTIYPGLDTIIDYKEITPETYLGYIEGGVQRPIVMLPPAGISYNEFNNESSYWIVGQVSRTDLSFYSPNIFESYLPVGAYVRKMTNYDPEQPENYYDDFYNDDPEAGFKFIHYRVYAESYTEGDHRYGDDYTDYYVAVTDVTNNVRFKLTIQFDEDDFTNEDNEPMIDYDKVFVTFNVYDYSDLDATLSSMSLFSRFYKANLVGTQNTFENNMSGVYTVSLDLKEGHTFKMEFIQYVEVDNENHSFVIIDSVVPRSYTMKITIIKTTGEYPWGEREIGNIDNSIVNHD